MTGVTSNSQQQDPAWLASFLQKHEGEQIKVTQGPGGMTINVAGESVFIGPSQMGVLNTFKGHDVVVAGAVNPADPFLLLPQTTAFTITPSWVSYFMTAITPPPDTGTDDSFGFNSGGGDKHLDSGLTMTVPGDLGSKDQSKVFDALVKYTGVDSNPGLSDEQKTQFKDQLHDMAAQIATKNANGPIQDLASGDATEISNFLASIVPKNSMSASDKDLFLSTLSDAATTINANEYTSGLQSTNKADVLTALMAFTGFDKDASLTPAQSKLFSAKLDDLAGQIATQNGTGHPDPALSSLDAKTLGTFLMSKVDISSLSQEDKVLFTNFMSEASVELSSINAASGQAPAKSAVLQGMESTDPATVLSTLKNTLSSQGLSDSQIDALSTKLTSLATTIATKNGTPNGAGLDITDASTMIQSLVDLLGADNDIANADLQAAIGALGTALAAENTQFFTLLSKSTDASVVFDALRHLSNIDHNPNLTPAERQAGLDYLKLMATALAFMSKIRAKVSMLEAELRKQESAGKLATIKDQTKAALDTFKTGIEKIKLDLQSQLNAIFMKKLMAILGPIILVILAIITAILSIVGCSAIGAALMIMVIVVMVVIAIADMETGMFDKLGKMCSKDKAGQEAASFGFQAIIMAIMIVFTLGAASFVCAAQIGAKAAEAGVELAIKEIMEAALNKVASQLSQSANKIVQFLIGEVVSILMSSGLLTDGFIKMFKAMGMSDKDAETASMVLTIIIMLVMMGAMLKSAGGMGKTVGGAAGAGAKAGANAAKDGVGDIVIETENTVKNTSKTTANKAADAAKDAGQTAGAAANDAVKTTDESAIETAIKALQKKLAQMVELAKDPQAFLKLAQALAMLAQIGSGVANAVNEFQQADLSVSMAKVTALNTETQALIDFLKTVVPTFDMVQQDVDNDSKDFMKGYNDLMGLFANMVASASTIVSQATQTA